MKTGGHQVLLWAGVAILLLLVAGFLRLLLLLPISATGTDQAAEALG